MQRIFPALPSCLTSFTCAPLSLLARSSRCPSIPTPLMLRSSSSQPHPPFPHLQASIPLHSSVPRPAASGFALPSQPMSLMQCLMAQVIESFLSLMAQVTSAVQVRRGGMRSLWQGSSANLMRDVPFSAIYWCLKCTLRCTRHTQPYVRCIVELVRDVVASNQPQSNNSSRDFGTNAVAAISGEKLSFFACTPGSSFPSSYACCRRRNGNDPHPPHGRCQDTHANQLTGNA